MFDVSLIELAVIALVALLVLGPERLPRAARTVGLYVRKARQSWYSVRADIERELAADELKRSIQRSGDDLRESIGIDRMRDDITGRKRLPVQSAAAAAATTEASVDAPPETVDGDPAPTPPTQSTADTPPRA